MLIPCLPEALGRPALTGIDDENITQVYGQNLAHGFGYVYTPHFEHSKERRPLCGWRCIGCFTQSPIARTIHSAMFGGLYRACDFWGLGIARTLSLALNLPRWTLWIPVLAVAVQPNYFHWTVVTMMDQGASVRSSLDCCMCSSGKSPAGRSHVLLCSVSCCVAS